MGAPGVFSARSRSNCALVRKSVGSGVCPKPKSRASSIPPCWIVRRRLGPSASRVSQCSKPPISEGCVSKAALGGTCSKIAIPLGGAGGGCQRSHERGGDPSPASAIVGPAARHDTRDANLACRIVTVEQDAPVADSHAPRVLARQLTTSSDGSSAARRSSAAITRRRIGGSRRPSSRSARRPRRTRVRVVPPTAPRQQRPPRTPREPETSGSRSARRGRRSGIRARVRARTAARGPRATRRSPSRRAARGC